MLIDFRNGMNGKKQKFPCLCFVAEQDSSSVAMTAVGTPPSISLRYSFDLENWQDFVPGTTTVPLATTRSRVWLKASDGGNTRFASSESAYWKFSLTGKIAAYGSIMSLLDPTDELRELDNETQQYCFSYLFYSCSALTIPPELPATTLSKRCYSKMFRDCTSLKKAPKLPALTAAEGCYSHMFYNCSSLEAAPELPATTQQLGNAGAEYESMFYNCTSMQTAPSILPMVNLSGDGPYLFMFRNCSSLSVAPEMLVSSFAGSSWQLQGMFQGCTNLRTPPPVLYAKTLPQATYYNMFSGCTSLTSAPEICATTLPSGYQFHGMFDQCKSMVRGPSKLPAPTVTNYAYNFMFGGCSSLTSAPELPATTVNSYGYNGMFYDCKSISSPPMMSATSIGTYGCRLMFGNCTSLSATPKLLAKSINTNSYESMFNGCTHLSVVDTQLTAFASNTTQNWLAGVASNGTFICPMQLGTQQTISRGTSACPNGWEVFNPDDNQLLCFTAEEASSIVSMKKSTDAAPAVTLQYMILDYEGWKDFIVDETCIQLNNIGDKVWFRAGSSGNAKFANSEIDYNNFQLSGKVSASGNIMSLLSDDCENMTSIDNAYCFSGLFNDCSALTQTPNLPIMQLAENCYQNMFKNCISLKSAILPAATLQADCYSNMFYGCSSLSSVTTNMQAFYPSNATTNWLSGVAATGEFICSENLGTKNNISRGPSYCPSGWTVSNTDNLYISFTSIEPNVQIEMKKHGSPIDLDLEYSIDKIIWQKFTPGTTIISLANAGDKIYLKAGLTKNIRINNTTDNYWNFSISGLVGCSGNIMSLLDSTKELLSIDYTYCFNQLFSNCSALVTAPDLPATTLASYCYSHMFSGCTSLSIAPELPASTLQTYCYQYMFQDCISLLSAPELPALTATTQCYRNMFENCMSLKDSPALPAIILAGSCYRQMFSGCSSLTAAPALTVNNPVARSTYAYAHMFQNCISLSCPPIMDITTARGGIFDGMFDGCIALLSAPEIRTTNAVSYSFRDMFNGCISLTSGPFLCATSLTTQMYKNIFAGCSSLTSISVALTSFNGGTYSTDWVSGIASNGTFYCPTVLGNDSTIERGVNACPDGWTVQNI